MNSTLTREDVSIQPCRCGRLVRLAYQPRTTCARCGEPIPSGAVGVVTGDDCAPGRFPSENRHGWAESWFECGHCAWHNPPTEVTEYLGVHYGNLAAAIEAGLRKLAAR